MTGKSTQRQVLIITTLTSFLTPFIGSSINIALPTIGKEFGLSALVLGWIATSFILTTAALLLPAGRLTDIYGRVKLFKMGILIFSAGSLLCAVAWSGEVLIIFRVIQGIGGSFIFSTSTAILVSSFPPESRGKVLGINVASVYSGLSLGPVLGGFITQYLGWRHLFSINAFLGVIIMITAHRILKMEWADAKGESFDLKGSLLYAIVLITFMYGFSILPQTNGIFLVALGLAGFIWFIKYEMNVTDPVLNVSLFRTNRVFAFSNLAALINYSATFAAGFLLSFYLQYIKGMTPRGAGMILVAQPVVMAVFSPLSGKLSDKREPQIVASVGMIMATIGLIIFSFLTPETSETVLVISLIFLGLGFALFSSPNTNAVMSSVEKKFYGIASSSLSTMRVTGQMLSMGLALMIFSLFIGNSKMQDADHTALMSGIKWTFGLFSAICFFGIFASLSRGKTRK